MTGKIFRLGWGKRCLLYKKQIFWNLYGLLLCLLPALLPYVLTARPVQYELNIHNGLPSNHIYYITVDKYGYLWAATPQGVVKYNGYTPRIFDLSKGLPSNDIWRLYEDSKGRIWIHCFCHSLGYIYNNEYKEITIEAPPPLLFPNFWNYEDHTFMFSSYDYRAFNNKMYLYKNDTLNEAWFNMPNCYNFYINNNKELVYLYKKILPGGEEQFAIYKKKMESGRIKTWVHNPIHRDMHHNRVFHFFGQYMMSVNASEGDVYYMHMEDSVWKKIKFDYTGQFKIHGYKGNMYIAAGENLYQFSDSFRQTAVYDMKQLRYPLSFSAFARDSFWHTCIGTVNTGLHMDVPVTTACHRVHNNRTDYLHVGRTPEGTHFWWGGADNMIRSVDGKGNVLLNRKYNIPHVYKIVPWKQGTSLVLTAGSLYELDHRTGNLTPFLHKQRLIAEATSSVLEKIQHKHIRYLDIAVVDSGLFFLLSRTGLFRMVLDPERPSLRVLEEKEKISQSDMSAYTNLAYDPLHKVLWTYNSSVVMRYDPAKGKGTTVHAHTPGKSYFRNIEKVLIDKRYGNVFLKEFDKLSLFNTDVYKFQVLYRNINLEKTQVKLEEDLLIVAGRFGVVLRKITGAGQLSPPLFYSNTKKMLYNELSDLYVIQDKIYINTDGGLYAIDVPAEQAFYTDTASGKEQPYKLLLGYGNDWRSVGIKDTVFLDQKDMKLQFDIIRPSGVGTPKYHYRLAGADPKWKEIHTDELLLPLLDPGRLYVLSIAVSDEVWKSGSRDICLYVVPYWWQTATAKRILSFAALLIFGLLVWGIVWITKRNVMRKNQKRNLHMEMELKSVYAQINPHFIFNTLSAALMLIQSGKMQDAYRHVTQFAQLLRAYLRSSRNRFITIVDEAENLKNYIELQQIRFDGRFHYEMILELSPEEMQRKIPSLLLQPIVENAINHGLFHKGEPGFLKIHFKTGQDGEEIICTIEDDGIGRKQSKQIRKDSSLKSESYGDKLIEDLIRICNKYESIHISVTYTDKETPLTGTIVTLKIKKTT